MFCLRDPKTFINCLLIIVATPFMVLAATNTQELQEQIKARMNAAPGNKCTSITLVQNSDGKYTGTAELTNGTRLAIDAEVGGSDIQYTFKQPAPIVTQPDHNVTTREPNLHNEQVMTTVHDLNDTTALAQSPQDLKGKVWSTILEVLAVVIIVVVLF
ncbi:MAG: hypothetical protein A2Y12_03625 [Planctomycetes bacterium GWF2_42_9]|nr:MAG: hypothetical protein A2Y12_03625 [Planctomycetes bacterium GWF2_42_9]